MPSRLSLNLARSYYVVAGLIAAAAGVVTILGAIGSALGGCALVFSQADFVNPAIVGPNAPNLVGCQQYVDVLAIGVELAVGVALLLTAWFLTRDGRTAGVLVRAGSLLGIAAGAAPGAYLLWLFNYYRQPIGPIEVSIGAIPLVAALLAAWVTWRAQGHHGLERIAAAV